VRPIPGGRWGRSERIAERDCAGGAGGCDDRSACWHGVRQEHQTLDRRGQLRDPQGLCAERQPDHRQAGRRHEEPGDEPELRGADAVDAALRLLALEDARKARVVELRFFGGLTIEETAVALEVSARTVYTDWAFARAWLSRALSGAHAD